VKQYQPPTPADLLRATDAQIEARLDEMAILSMAWFTRRMWHVVEPGTPLVDNWHLDAVCDEVQAQLEGKPGRQDLLVNIPPGFLKSIIVSVMRPAWCWLHWPHRRSIYVSNTDDLASRDSRRTRDVLKSEAYQRLVASLAHPSRAGWKCPSCRQGIHPAWKFAQDQDEKDNFANDRMGFRACIPMGSRGKTGHRADDVVFDDPVDADVLMKASPEMRRQILREADRTIGYVETTRINNPRTATRTVVMQRLHEDDPAGVRQREGGWRLVSLPQHFDPERACEADRRTVEGELLCPDLWDEEALARPLRKLGHAQFMAQHEQKPLREEGGLFKVEYFGRRYTEDARQVVARCDEVAISVDCTFKGSETSDRVAIQCWGREGSRFYLLDRVCERMGFLATVEAIRSMKRRWPEARVTLVEAAANGPAVMEVLGREFPGVIPFNPRGSSKYERAKVGALPAFEAGNVWLPAESVSPWVEAYVAEMLAFGDDCEHDDEVDATSQLMLRWTALGAGDAAVDVPYRPARPVLETGVVTRWSEPVMGARYVMGLCAGWATSAGTGAAGVVLDETGAQVAMVRVEVGGPEAVVDVAGAECVYWNMAEVVVGGEPRDIAHRVAVGIARLGPRVLCRPKMYVYDGASAVYGRREHVELWGRLGQAARGELVLVRDAAVASAVSSVVVGADGVPRGEASSELPAEAVALMLACRSRVVEERKPGEVARRRVVVKERRGDAWSRTALTRNVSTG